MVNNNNNDTTKEDENEITYDTAEPTETDLVDDEAQATDKIKQLRTKLTEAQDKSRELHEELQRVKADYLNARRHLEEDMVRTRQRDTERHAEKLLPLADSFYLAMLDKAAWEQSDERWRKGVEGIHQQLLGVLRSYGIESYDPTGETFDPIRHEAMGTVPVTEAKMHDVVLTVMQLGYTMTQNGTTTVLRPARVSVGTHTE